MNEYISKQAVIDAINRASQEEWNENRESSGVVFRILDKLDELPTETKWDNHEVACLLAELYDDPCACNYNDNDEWLPIHCELLDVCPEPCGVACWEQFLKHRNKAKEVKE